MLPIVFLAVLSLLGGSVESRAVFPKPHVIVFDCGSTKTTMNIFQFSLNKEGLWELQQSLSYRWNKALSRFSPDSEADKGELDREFAKLFQKANSIITNGAERPATPVFLYATAGLRALPKERAEALLKLSRDAIKKSPYDKRSTKDGMERVAMITGNAEGLYAWLAVNYLTSPNINKQKANEDFAMVDLGGGSTQIAFRPDNFDLLKKAGLAPSSLTNPLRKKPNPSLGPGVFSKTYNDYGNSANIMKMVGAFDDCKAKTGCPKNKVYKSVCLHPKYKGEFVFGPNKFKIEGKPLKDPSKRYRICQNQAIQVLKKYGVKPINTMEDIRNLLTSTTFLGISGYYYATTYINKLKSLASADRTCKGFKLTVGEFVEGAKRVCKNPINAADAFSSYSCMQAVYLSVLMTHGYQLPLKNTLYTCEGLYARNGNDVKTVKANWALGVALQAAKRILEPDMATINRK